MSRDEFAERVREEAVQALLDDDARVVRNILADVRVALREYDELLGPDNHAWAGQRALAWWRSTKSGLPTSLAHFEPYLRAGGQPVFCNVSLYVLSSAPTLYVPVPYLEARNGYPGFCRSIWLDFPGWKVEGNRNAYPCSDSAVSAPVWLKEDEVEWEFVARQYSHAIANISYSVRVGDRPILGWLATAHAMNKAIYLPDVHAAAQAEERIRDFKNELQGASAVRTVAVSDERYLGMASVLYIPLSSSHHLPTLTIGGLEHAQAVLMLWSPVPHRWDSLCASGASYVAEGAFEVPEANVASRGSLCSELAWLGDFLAKDRCDQLVFETRLLAFINSIDLLASHSSIVREEFEGLMHHLLPLFELLRSDGNVSSTQPISVRGWLRSILDRIDPNALISLLEFKWDIDMASVPLTIHLMTPDDLGTYCPLAVEGVARATIGELESALALIPDGATLFFGGEIARVIGCEPESNISRYALGLHGVDVVVSASYITVRYREEPLAEAVNRLLEGEEGFRRYFAVRRGLAVPSVEDPDGANYDHGLGLSLFNAVASRVQIYRRLYIAPDGSDCHVEIAVPFRLGE